MIFIKDKFKRFIYLSICLSILLFTLPFSASAAVSNAFNFEFYNSDTSWIEDSSARSAYEAIEFYYLAPMSGEGGYVEEPFVSDMSFSVAYGGDFTYSFKFVNNSNYEFKFGVTAFYVGTYGPFVIPAATSEGPGEFYYTVDSSVVTSSEFERLSFNFSSYQPVYVNPSVNTSYSILQFKTPNGIFREDRLYPPSDTTGEYTAPLTNWIQDGSIDSVPLLHEGYRVVTYTIPTDIVIDPTSVNTYVIEYDSSGKVIQINYYDQNGNFITQESFFADVNDTSFTIPSMEDYIFAPLKVPLTVGINIQSFNVYRIDFSGLRDKYYQEGFDAGSESSSDLIQSLVDEAYQNGYQAGIKKNGLVQSEIDDIRKDYNVFTAFFDGLFNGFLSFYNVITNGIAFGGVTLGNVITTVLIAVICYFVARVILG